MESTPTVFKTTVQSFRHSRKESERPTTRELSNDPRLSRELIQERSLSVKESEKSNVSINKKLSRQNSQSSYVLRHQLAK